MRVARTACRSWNRRLARLTAYGVSQNSSHPGLDDAPDLNADNAPDLQLVLAQLACIAAHTLIWRHPRPRVDVRRLRRDDVGHRRRGRRVYRLRGLLSVRARLSLRSVDDVDGWGAAAGS
jgi:hypothetical protein